MFCPNCGTTIEDSQQFCPNCGTAVEAGQETNTQQPEMQQPNNNGYTPQAVPSATPSNGAGLSPKVLVSIILGAIAVIAIIVVVAVVAHIQSTKIDLNEYVKGVDFDGYDTVGTATVDFNAKKLYKDCDEISKKVKKVKDKDYDKWASKELGVKFELSEDSELSNGDTITLKWDVDADEIKKEFGIRVSCKDMEFEVKKLDEVDVVDVFEYVELSYSGTEPNGWVSVNVSDDADSSWKNSVYFNVEGTDDVSNGSLSNGDTIVVSLSQENDYYADYYGFVAKELSKEYTVDGLEYYAKSFDDIPEDTLKAMHDEAKYDFEKDYANNWDDGQSLSSFEYVGYYFMTPDGTQDYVSYNNYLYLIYQVDVSLPGDVSSFTYYNIVRYYNIKFDGEGECDVDPASDGYTVYNWIDTDIRIPNSYGDYYFYGYESLDDFEEDYIDEYEHDYHMVTDKNVE